ncbi:aldehyde dehydrogenase (NADP(+)) [Arthrobacter crystallopoietes]|uniref:NADP-dependent aldehyde dehydrogenase n=1 Tax=Crystallibacter crystallopoietes TaxID=37928 RepID=A0A1H0ZKK7_9MICC|nr:aldehyde dehydrogenase (NADP(+)) [Arthrobacter crystallopoietes]AUI51928.1 aldehyde dehydrogenase (NADP(+)) [Arthrobacter crystallopoietes]SDQ28045.1 NADP-dependent aldehyde dehydrogenase [Arthrobacter crystallopoietes]
MTATSAEQAASLIQTAHSAYEQVRNVTPETRGSWLEAIAAGLEQHADDLVGIAGRETHLAEARLRFELKRSVFQLRLFRDEILRGENLDATIDHADPEWGMGPRPDIRKVNVPLGVVGVFGASNFPFAFSVMGGDSASALAAGCAVVHKIHDGHLELGLRTGEIVVEALAAAGAPAGLFATVTGRAAAEALVDHPLVMAIGFTGSTAGGRALFDRASRRPVPIPFYGELGSINPVFVTEEAWSRRKDEILSGYAGSFTMGMGQFCTKPGLLFAPVEDTEDVTRLLERELEGKPVAPLLSPRLREGYDSALAGVRDTEGVQVLIQGNDDDAPSPTVLSTSADAVRERPELLEQEMFGPATLLIGYKPGSDLAELAALLQGQLTATVQAEPEEELGDLLTVLREKSGRVLWNSWPTGVTVSYAQQHGGPYPATTAPGTTSVGTAAIRRFMRPVAYDSFPATQLPPPLQEDNPWGIARRVDGQWERPAKGGN